jgi:hypothetical protein
VLVYATVPLVTRSAVIAAVFESSVSTSRRQGVREKSYPMPEMQPIKLAL